MALRGRDLWPQTHFLSGVDLKFSSQALEVHLKQELVDLGKSPYLHGPVVWGNRSVKLAAYLLIADQGEAGQLCLAHSSVVLDGESVTLATSLLIEKWTEISSENRMLIHYK